MNAQLHLEVGGLKEFQNESLTIRYDGSHQVYLISYLPVVKTADLDRIERSVQTDMRAAGMRESVRALRELVVVANRSASSAASPPPQSEVNTRALQCAVAVWDVWRFPFVTCHFNSATLGRQSSWDLIGLQHFYPGFESLTNTAATLDRWDLPECKYNLWEVGYELLRWAAVDSDEVHVYREWVPVMATFGNPEPYKLSEQRVDGKVRQFNNMQRCIGVINDIISRLACRYHVYSNMDRLLGNDSATSKQFNMVTVLAAVTKLSAQLQWNRGLHSIFKLALDIVTYLLVMKPVLVEWHQYCQTYARDVGLNSENMRGLVPTSTTRMLTEGEKKMLPDMLKIVYTYARYGTMDQSSVVEWREPKHVTEHTSKFLSWRYERKGFGIVRFDRTTVGDVMNANVGVKSILMSIFPDFSHGAFSVTHRISGPQEGDQNAKDCAVWALSMPGECEYVVKLSVVGGDAINAAARLLQPPKSYGLTLSTLQQKRMNDDIEAVLNVLEHRQVSQEYLVTQRLRQMGVVEWTPLEQFDFAVVSSELLYVSVMKRMSTPAAELFAAPAVRRLEDASACGYMIATCYSALRRTHLAGVVHGDPHLNNFMASKTGIMHLIDWDSAVLDKHVLAAMGIPPPDTVRGFSIFTRVNDDDRPSDDTEGRTQMMNRVVPAADALLFFVSVFFRLGKMVTLPDTVTPLDGVLHRLAKIPGIQEGLTTAMHRLVRLLGAGNSLLAGTRQAYIGPESSRTNSEWLDRTRIIQEAGRRDRLQGGDLSRLTMHQVRATEHYSQLLSKQQEVLEVLDDFFIGMMRFANPENRAKFRILMNEGKSVRGDMGEWYDACSSLPRIPIKFNQKNEYQRRKLEQRYMLGKFVVFDTEENKVWTFVPNYMSQTVWLPKWEKQFEDLELKGGDLTMDKLVHTAYDGWWVVSSHVLHGQLPAGFSFNEKNRALYLWNRLYIDQLSPLFHSIVVEARHEMVRGETDLYDMSEPQRQRLEADYKAGDGTEFWASAPPAPRVMARFGPTDAEIEAERRRRAIIPSLPPQDVPAPDARFWSKADLVSPPRPTPVFAPRSPAATSRVTGRRQTTPEQSRRRQPAGSSMLRGLVDMFSNLE